MNLKINETGRSMVEMLGVLAIIGVLSIGAIAGYKYAMNKHRANEIINNLEIMNIALSGEENPGERSGSGYRIVELWDTRKATGYLSIEFESMEDCEFVKAELDNLKQWRTCSCQEE